MINVKLRAKNVYDVKHTRLIWKITFIQRGNKELIIITLYRCHLVKNKQIKA